MPRHVLIMWLIAGGGTLVGASLMYLTTRPRFADVWLRSSWRRGSFALPSLFSKPPSVRSASAGRIDRDTTSPAFHEYRESQIAKLETEEREFRRFLQTLRDARDREVFEEFMKVAKSGHQAKAVAAVEKD